MEVVVCAGGRGSRCGALTKKRHKGAIQFQGAPLIHHVLGSFSGIKGVTRILVVTGYKQETISEAVASFSKKDSDRCRIDLVHGPDEIIGTCRRLTYVIPHLADCRKPGLYRCGNRHALFV